MWLLPKSVYVPDTGALQWESNELLEMFARSVTWKTKSLQPESWRRVLRKESWIARLFIPTLKLSIQSPGAESTSSQGVTPASPFPSQASGKVQKTPAICGHTSESSLTLSDRKSASSRTSGGTFDWDCPKCLANSEDLATELGREYSQRRKSARRTEEKEFLSWLTTRAGDWGTLRVATNGGSGKFRKNDRSRLECHGKSHGRCLAADVQLWPTPRAGKIDAEKEDVWRKRQNQGKVSTPPLGLAVTMLWRTPSATDGVGGAMDMERARKEGLRPKLKLRDHVLDPETLRESAGRDTTIENRWPARPGESQHEWEVPRTVDGKLNPCWVEQLMGLRTGWTQIDPDTQKHREQRLRACGNGVVPQQAEFAIRTLMEAMERE